MADETRSEARGGSVGEPRLERPNRESQLARLANAIEPYDLASSPAMQRVANGEATLDLARALARQYYPVCVQFPLLLARCISRIHDEAARIVLVENLYEEHGRLDETRAHPRLFRRFVAAVELDPTLIDRPESGSPAEILIDEYTRNIGTGGEHVALAYLFSFEKHFSGGMECIARGLRASKLVPEDALAFFDVHAIEDVEHAEKLQEALVRVTSTTKQWSEACDAAARSAELLYALFDSVFSGA